MCLLLAILMLSQPSDQTVIVTSSYDGSFQPLRVIVERTAEPAPLLVLLHHWSNGVDRFEPGPWREEAARRGWRLVIPHYRGPNNRPEACASSAARQDVLDAVDYMTRMYAVDATRIYLAGTSGGGHMAMVMAAHAPERWAGVSAWVGISDLAMWHAETKAAGRDYWNDIEAVVGGEPGSSAEVDAQLRTRSPIYALAAAKDVPMDLNAGIHDGHTGSVPIHHTLNAFNIIARALGAKEIDAATNFRLSTPRPLDSPEEQDATYGRAIHLRRYAGASRVTIFEGGHEDIPKAACAWLEGRKK